LKDVTSTSFGLVIAFLLPGLAALYALALWAPSILEMFRTFLTSNSNIGLFLLVIAIALSLGLVVTVFRWFLFERWLCKSHCLNPFYFAQLSNDAKLVAFRAAIDEHYRYHQFWGGMTVILPVLYLGWLVNYWKGGSLLLKALSFLVFIGIEYVLGRGAVAAYTIFIARAKSILEQDNA